MARHRLILRPILVIGAMLSIIILSVSSEEIVDETSQLLTIKNLSFAGEPMPGEGVPDQDEVVEYRAPSHPFYRPFIPFKRFWQPVQNSVGNVPKNSEAESAPVNISQRKKKDCGFPVLTRRLFGPVMKRSLHYFANSEDEIQEKIKEEDKDLETSEAYSRSTRSTETHSGGCLAKRQWIDMGSDYYPRYVKSYHCSSNTCDRGFGNLGECKPKLYKLKVLKRITTSDSMSVEDCDQTLPEDLRVAWKFFTISVTTCCDCVSPSHLFGLK